MFSNNWRLIQIIIYIIIAFQRISAWQAIVCDRYSSEPIPSVHIKTQEKTILSDSLGRFKVSEYRGICTFAHIAFEELKLELSDQMPDTVYLQPKTFDMAPVEISRSQDPVISADGYRLTAELHTRMPFAYSNIYHIVKVLPGVISNNELSNSYWVRGGNFNENLIYINQIEITQPFILRKAIQENAGLPNPYMVKEFNFSSGGMDVSYGDKLSSVLNIQYFDQIEKAIGGYIHASLMDFNGVLNSQIDRRLHLIAGFRRNRLTHFFNGNKLKGQYTPDLYDFQLSLNYQPSSALQLNFITINNWRSFYLAPESKWVVFQDTYLFNFRTVYFDFAGSEETKFNTFVQSIELNWRPTHKEWQWRHTLNRYISQEKMNSDIVTRYEITENFFDSLTQSIAPVRDSGEIDTDTMEYDARNHHIIHNQFRYSQWQYHSDWNWRQAFKLGFELSLDQVTDNIEESNHDYDQRIELTEQYEFSDYFTLNTNKIALYGAYSHALWQQLKITLGLRYFYSFINRENILQPRLKTEITLSNGLTLYTSVGFHAQPPTYREAGFPFDLDRIKKLKSQKSIEYIGGFKTMSSARRIIKIEFFYKDQYNLIPYYLNDMQLVYTGQNNARGYATGFDLYMGGNLVDSLYSWITYSYLITRENINGDGLGFLPRPSEQNHTLTFFAQDQIKNHPEWRTTLKLLLGSGISNFYKKKTFDSQRNIWYLTDNKRLSDHFPFYFRLDIGIYRDIILKSGSTLTFSIQFINIFDRQNVQFYQYVADMEGRVIPIKNHLLPRTINLTVDFSF